MPKPAIFVLIPNRNDENDLLKKELFPDPDAVEKIIEDDGLSKGSFNDAGIPQCWRYSQEIAGYPVIGVSATKSGFDALNHLEKFGYEPIIFVGSVTYLDIGVKYTDTKDALQIIQRSKQKNVIFWPDKTITLYRGS